MLPENTLKWGQNRNCIRELFEYGNARKAEIGPENVFDFSLGNPNIPAPDCVNEAIAELIRGDSVALHGYTSATGRPQLRRAIARQLTELSGLAFDPDTVYVTCGAAAGLASALRGLLLPGEEVISFAPFFPEYRVFTEAAGGSFVALPPTEDFQTDAAALAAAITERTKAVIINSPNNPSGVILSEQSIAALCDTLAASGREIYLISDEPYRELVYDGAALPTALGKYPRTIVCYSFSKSLSIPGERIGYLALSPEMPDAARVYASIAGAARSLGYVCAPSLLQQVAEKCIGATADISKYRENRDLIYGALTDMGYSCVMPQGAFYLFVKSPEPDAKAFSDRAKAHELLLVPADDFGCPGYVRISYCVSREMIGRSLPAFKALMDEYRI